MYELDFLPVENEDGDSTRSGDAITARFTHPTEDRQIVIAVDAGFSAIGATVADHIQKYYKTNRIDLVVSTHPDTDHLNGLKTLLETCDVDELLIHKPWLHNHQAHKIGNYERIVEIVELAESLGVTVTEPFAGLMRFGGAVTLLGPTKDYYSEMLAQAISEADGTIGLSASARFSATLTKGVKVLRRTLSAYPFELLTDVDDTGPRNNMSVITLLNVDSHRMLLTGDAGIRALDQGIDVYEVLMGDTIAKLPLHLLQAPHHGSHHNLGPTVLDRILGPVGAPHSTGTSAFISSSEASEKHPSPRVTNALGRREAAVFVTEGRTICHWTPGTTRDGWGNLSPLGPIEEA